MSPASYEASADQGVIPAVRSHVDNGHSRLKHGLEEPSAGDLVDTVLEQGQINELVPQRQLHHHVELRQPHDHATTSPVLIEAGLPRKLNAPEQRSRQSFPELWLPTRQVGPNSSSQAITQHAAKNDESCFDRCHVIT